MRILVSNPDTLGDLILRQPMFRALLDAGNELMLIVRPAVAPLVRHVAPGAEMLELPYEAYADDLPQHWDRFAGLFDAARAFAPDVLVVAPYRWTAFDERLADELPAGVKRAGLSGHLYHGDPHRGRAPRSGMRFDVVADVCEDAPEVEKNAALASAVLGEPRPKTPADPRIALGDSEQDRAAQILSGLGLAPGEYWVACVTGTAHVSLKAWHRDRWADALSRWPAPGHGNGQRPKFLFVGVASEEPDARAVLDAMSPDARDASRLWMPADGTIDELLGLTALSAGYVGHDTGPMHAAAALGKPVLAVFGGGHKLRFRPAVSPSVTVTVGVSCRGCQWVCSFAESHCVKAIPVDDVLKAADDLEAGRVDGREARVLEPSAALQSQMVREAARVAEERLRESAELSREVRETHEKWGRDVARLREETETNLAAQRAAVERAHAELGGQLREKESVIREQHEQLAGHERALREKEQALHEKDRALHEQHAILEERDDALRRTAAEAASLRGHAEAAQRENANLTATLAARAGELSRLSGEFETRSREAAELASVVETQRAEITRLHDETGAALRLLEQAQREGGEAAKRQSEEIVKLREQMQQLEERLRRIEPSLQPRRPLKQVLVDFIIGPQHYYPPPPKALPGVTIVTVIDAGTTPGALRDTVASVTGQTHAHVQYVVIDRGASADARGVLEKHRERIDKLVDGDAAGSTAADALAAGFNLATYDVIGQLQPGDVLEPGALTRVAEHFRDHPAHKAAVFAEGIADGAGWRFPAARRPTPGVYRLLSADAEALDTAGGAFVTTNAYKALGGINRERGAAGPWDFWIRLARRYGIHAGDGHVRTRTRPHAPAGTTPDAKSAEEFANARRLFESSFGVTGRVRCTLIDWFDRVDDARRRRHASADRLSYPLAVNGATALPGGVAPAGVPADQPVSPVTGRMPDRLLFSTRDTAGGDDAISYVYRDEQADMALVYPPIDLDRLQAIYDKGRRDRPSKVIAPQPGRLSPFAGYRGRRAGLAHILSRVRSPYWWFRRPDFGDPAVDELLASLDGPVPRRGVAVRFLNVGCFEGRVLETLKRLTDWELAGTETNADAAREARDKGFTVWETSAQDAALVLPVDQQFDVIYLGGLLEHLPDPLLVLRRLRQLLSPGGRIVIDTPNLDSKLLDVFGPTWSQWQVPYHRALIGRRGLRKLARRGSFRVERVRTRTHALAAVRSVQLNELGLGAVVPDTAEFPPDVASRGVLLTGWARLLWDWRGRGDHLYAVLRAE